jgi:hypothetical protein
MSDARLARIEERQIAHSRLIEDFIAEQRKANAAFWETKSSVDKAQSKVSGAFWVLSMFGGLTVFVSGVVAFAVEQRHVILGWFKGGS